jgi:hypothetical protein
MMNRIPRRLPKRVRWHFANAHPRSRNDKLIRRFLLRLAREYRALGAAATFPK